MCCSRFDVDTAGRPMTAAASGAALPASAKERPALHSVIALGAAVIVALAVAAAGMVAGATEPTHQLTLVARDMAFYLDQGTEPNPRIEVPAREEVRITLVNRDTGIDHDLAVTSLGLESRAIPGDGSSITIAFRAPRDPGEHEYVCQLHGQMMRGTLVVR